MLTKWTRIVPGLPRICNNALRDHGGLGNIIFPELTPQQRYKLQNSRARWDKSEKGRAAKEITTQALFQGEIGRIEGFRFIVSEGL